MTARRALPGARGHRYDSSERRSADPRPQCPRPLVRPLVHPLVRPLRLRWSAASLLRPPVFNDALLGDQLFTHAELP